MKLFSIIYNKWDKYFGEKLFHWTKNNPNDLFCICIEADNFSELEKFIQDKSASKYSKNIFFNMIDGNERTLQRHLSNYSYMLWTIENVLKPEEDFDYFIWLNKYFSPDENFTKFIKNYNTGLVWHNKNELGMNKDIVVQWFSRDIIKNLYNEYYIKDLSVDFDIDIHNDIIKLYLDKLDIPTTYEANCRGLDCLRAGHIYPLWI